MKKDEWREKWHKCDSSMMLELSGVTDMPGVLTTMPVSGLNINLQNMPGTQTVYLSGYVLPQEEVPEPLGARVSP
ncbi:MAG: hypothetical protein H8E68_00100 [Kiritimatiellaeota bacterium]|nr:hypothetical protein [Kiritimatiellota bacterium]